MPNIRPLTLLLVVALALTWSRSASSEEFRQWSDVSGSFKTEAAFVALSDGQVQLLKKDGKTVKVALEKLSAVDQGYVRLKTMPEMPVRKPTDAKKVPADQPTGEQRFVPYELTPDEVAKYPTSGLDVPTVVASGSVTNGESAKFAKVLRELDSTKPDDRVRVVKEFVRIVGEPRARRLTLRFCGADGNAKYVWPPPEMD